MQCKDCRWCTWMCPGYMCMNPKHPDFEEDNDYPLEINPTQESCAFIEQGESDYLRALDSVDD